MKPINGRPATEVAAVLGRLPQGPGNSTPSDRNANFVRAHVLWIAVTTLIVTLGAALYSYSQTPMYKAEAEVLVQPRVYSTTSAPQAPDMGTEKAVASSGTVLTIAAEALGVPERTLGKGWSVSVPLNTHILQIGHTSRDPAEAQRFSQALASAYVTYWLQQQSAAKAVSTAKPGTAPAPAANTAIITAAGLPTAPSSPDHTVDLAIAVFLGLALGAGPAFLRDRWDDGLRSVSDLELYAGASVIGLIPGHKPRFAELPARLVMVTNPQSAVATAYRELRTRVLHAGMRRRGKILLVTSPSRGDQAVIAANLAVSLAEAGQKVTHVSVDVRSQQTHTIFGLESDPGLTSVVHGNLTLHQALQETQVPGLTLLAAGSPDGDHALLLQQQALPRILGTLARDADFVIVDSPAVLAAADTSVVAEFVDMVLLVTDAKRTTRSEVTATVRQLELVHAKVIGCVMGNVGGRERLTSSGLPALAGTEPSPVMSRRRAERNSPWRVTAKAQEAGQG
jgi:succinoglycan biosynthesis transport protein ExoP